MEPAPQAFRIKLPVKKLFPGAGSLFAPLPPCQEGSAALQQAFEQIPKQKAEQREHAQSIAEIHQPAKGEIYISGHSQQDDGKQKKGKKRMKQIGNVEVPQKAFLAVLKLD